MVRSEASLARHLRNFADYYLRSRTHLDCRRTCLSHAPSKRQKPGGPSPSRCWAVSISGINVTRPETLSLPVRRATRALARIRRNQLLLPRRMRSVTRREVRIKAQFHARWNLDHVFIAGRRQEIPLASALSGSIRIAFAAQHIARRR
jgi:hypothetical protein